MLHSQFTWTASEDNVNEMFDAVKTLGATPGELLALVGHSHKWAKFPPKKVVIAAEKPKRKANDLKQLKAFAVERWPELKILFAPKDPVNVLYVLSIAILANRMMASEERQPSDDVLYKNAFVAMDMARVWLDHE